MSRRVHLTDGAARDLDECFAWHYAGNERNTTDRFMDRIQDVLDGLELGHVTGHPIPSLTTLGLSDTMVYAEDSLRIIYRVFPEEIHVIAIALPNQTYQALLQRRMFDA